MTKHAASTLGTFRAQWCSTRREGDWTSLYIVLLSMEDVYSHHSPNIVTFDSAWYNLLQCSRDSKALDSVLPVGG